MSDSNNILQAEVYYSRTTSLIMVCECGAVMLDHSDNFSSIAGEPYQVCDDHKSLKFLFNLLLQYVGGDTNTVPFDQAPAVVLARSLIQKRILQALEVSSEFNEVLRLDLVDVVHCHS